MRTHEELWKLMKNWANLARIVKRTVGTGQLSSSTNVSVNFPNFPTFQKARLRSKKAILASLALAPGLDSSRSTPVASYTLEWTSEYTDSETTRSESYIFSYLIYLITAAVNLAFYWMFGFLLSELCGLRFGTSKLCILFPRFWRFFGLYQQTVPVDAADFSFNAEQPFAQELRSRRSKEN